MYIIYYITAINGDVFFNDDIERNPSTTESISGWIPRVQVEAWKVLAWKSLAHQLGDLFVANGRFMRSLEGNECVMRL